MRYLNLLQLYTLRDPRKCPSGNSRLKKNNASQLEPVARIAGPEGAAFRRFT
jgi:hypothetical protein